MKRWRWILCLGLMVVQFNVMATPLLLLDTNQLARLKMRVQHKDPFLMPAYRALIKDANEALRKLFKTPISERWGKQICLNE